MCGIGKQLTKKTDLALQYERMLHEQFAMQVSFRHDWSTFLIRVGGVSKRGYCCCFVRRSEVCSPENGLLCVFGQATPASTAETG